MKKKDLDFRAVSKRLNEMNGKSGWPSSYSMKEIIDLFGRVGFPKTPGLFKYLKEFGIVQQQGKGKWVLRQESPIHYMSLMKAYVAFRKDCNSYTKKRRHSVKAKPTVVVPAVIQHEDVITETQIQQAIKVLKACGDRFQITEKKITVTYEIL